ncbi:MAG: hypothetical protein DRN06_03225 [Thermoprotei archaeon]|nr:MAG: hypothetical protein DRN06_03225 [Thermoprotei archaeon]
MKVVLGKPPKLEKVAYLTHKGRRPLLLLPKQLLHLFSSALVLDRAIWHNQANEILSYYDLLPKVVTLKELEAYVYSLEPLLMLMRNYFSSNPLPRREERLVFRLVPNMPHTSLLTLLNPQLDEFGVENYVIDLRRYKVDEGFLNAVTELLNGEVYLVKERVDSIVYDTIVPADYPRVLLSRMLDPRAKDKAMRAKTVLIRPGVCYAVEDCNYDFLSDDEIEDVRASKLVEELDYLKIVFKDYADSVYAVLDELVELGSMTYRQFNDYLTNQFRKSTAKWILSLLVRTGFVQLMRTSGGLEVYPTDRAYKVILSDVEVRRKETYEVS